MEECPVCGGVLGVCGCPIEACNDDYRSNMMFWIVVILLLANGFVWLAVLLVNGV